MEGSFVERNGERYYCIAGYDAMPPFLMSLVSDSDHWLFISSTGALTAGRKDPDHALFPYYNDDRIHDAQDQTGSKTIVRLAGDGAPTIWQPFSPRCEGIYCVSRRLYKSVFGNKIVFEEVNQSLGLTFRYEWALSERFGFVRHACLENESNRKVEVEVLDGIQNVLPAGVTRRFQLEYSTLVDGYKRTELERETGTALFRLSSIPVDRPEPSEALRVNVAWSAGLDPAARLLSSNQLRSFRRGCPVEPESDVVGCRGAYFIDCSLELCPYEKRDWFVVADVGKDAADVRALLKTLRQERTLRAELEADIKRGTKNLTRIVARADGLQCTADEASVWRHFSNTLFNVMRGGLPEPGYQIRARDFAAFLNNTNRDVANRYAAFFAALPETLPHSELIARASKCDPAVERIAREYLPLTFSRRHGDPSRPWNIFSIEVMDECQQRILNYEGNWRDIFQNWEALTWAFPSYTESMIAKFLNSCTADGYNPSRIMRDGYEWDVLDPEDDWSYIGYWGDHQIIYLLKLLEQSRRFHPGYLSALLARRVFAYADIPYRIKPYEEMVDSPRETITFDFAAHQRAMRLEDKIGAEGKSLRDDQGNLLCANLTEKLLVLILAKLSNYVPDAGIWMNTQRPEWNDANNALVGHGASVVTLCYLRRFIAFTKQLFESAEAEDTAIAAEVATMFLRISHVLREHEGLLYGPTSDHDRKSLLDGLGRAGSDYREQLYSRRLSGVQISIGRQQLIDFCDCALRHVEHSIRANRRDDGLYHAYNLISISEDGIGIRRLYEMLEGQVAVLSCGLLSGAEAVSLLDALQASRLYCADQQSYLLYPDRKLPHFLEKNNIPELEVTQSVLLQRMLSRGDGRIIVKDVDGQIHFNASFRNAEMLRDTLSELRKGECRALVDQEERSILELYEKVFDHQAFTGRSGTFYKYEGLGCVYWHMVSKLLLAVSELMKEFADSDAATFRRLQAHYVAVRRGLGTHKTPEAYGAIPTDPYSHTPKAGGAQQPGMTGQVKEDFICRIAELGLNVEDGQMVFLQQLIPDREFLEAPAVFEFVDVNDRYQRLNLSKGTLAFTFCETPIVLHKSGRMCVEVVLSDGSTRITTGLRLDSATSSTIFERSGRVCRLNVFLGRE